MKRIFLVAAIFIFALPGQEVSGKSAMIFNTGYYFEEKHVYTALGQLLSLSVHGVGQGIRDRIVAKGFPLPTKLAGISVTVNRYQAPLLGIIANRDCLFAHFFCVQYVTIVLQVPFEYRGGGGPPSEFLTVYEDDEPVAALSMSLWSSQVHVFTPVNTLGWFNKLGWLFPEFLGGVKKRDGTWASRFNTAKPGEELTLYAVGLGSSRDSSIPLPASGMPSPAGYQVDVGILFDFGENPKARPVMYDPWIGGSNKPPPMEGLIWAGLAEGKVGIYEVRFRVPETIPEGTPSCREALVSHNLMVSIGSIARSRRFAQPTYDGAGICVEVPSGLTAQ